jgi:predicted HTH transcriptional regulator
MLKKELLNFIHTHDESEILDYKENLSDAQAIGEYISALGNAALLNSNYFAYLIWGVKDTTKEIVGTRFNYHSDNTNHANHMPLQTFLETFVDPRLFLTFDELTIEEKKVTCLTIDVRNVTRPIKFKGKEYIRSGTSKKPLAEFPEKERRLWLSFETSKFELEFANTDLSWEEVCNLLDTDFFAKQLEIVSEDDLIKQLLQSKIITKTNSSFNITNLGAYTLAKDLQRFPYLLKRAVRITKYSGDHNYDNAEFDREGNVGIAVSFNNVIKVIMGLIPKNEDYSKGTRKDVPIFPKLAIRELVANALVHQDFTIQGSRPFVEIYDSRIEISNPGTPLIAPDRFLDYKPKSRNDELANVLGMLKIVESRGTGIDKVVHELEINDLPAMEISIQGDDNTVVELEKKKPFKSLSVTEKNQSIYWHACLKYVENKQIDNSSLRKRFNLDKNWSAQISSAINNAVEAELIKAYDPNAGRKFIKYIPYWGKNVQDK